MIDVLYIVGTLAFFALMIAYVAACDRLGRGRDAANEPTIHRRNATDERP
jgi:hypothetical protein